MNQDLKSALKRWGRVFFAGSLMWGLRAGLEVAIELQLGIAVIPVGTALVNAIGKFIRNRWSIKLPF